MPIEVRSSDHADTEADVVLRNPETGPRCHRALLDQGLDAHLLDALRELPGEQTGTYRAVLSEIGVDALDELVADLAANAAGALNWAEEHGFDVSTQGFEAEIPDSAAVPGRSAAQRHDTDPVALFLDVVRTLGSGMAATGQPTSRDDLHGAVPPLLEQAVDVEPRIVVDLSGGWFEHRRREHREDVLELLVALSTGAHVTLRPTTVARAKLHEQHRQQLPAHVTARLDPGRSAPPTVRGDVPPDVREAVQDAREDLDPDGRAAKVLVALWGEQSNSMTYTELERVCWDKSGSDSSMRVRVKRLRDRGLVERHERSDGLVSHSLTPAGLELLRRWRDENGLQTAFAGPTVPDPDPDRSSRERYTPPKNLLPCRVGPREVGGSTPEEAAAAAAGASAGGSRDRLDDYAHGAVKLGWMGQPRADAVAGAARDGEVVVCNAEIERLQDLCGDGREPAWTYDPADETLIVGAEHHNPLQWTVATARALAAPRTWEKVLGVDDVGEQLENLSAEDLDTLRDKRCIGWFPDEAEDDRGELADQFNEAYQTLLDLSRDLKHENYEDRDRFRGELMSYAHGLAGSMIHLLDCAGVDVARELRVPDFTDDYSKNGHESRRRDLCKMLAFHAAITSEYREHAAFRQLFERRDDKIDQSPAPPIDAADPTGEMLGSVVIAGHGAEGLQEDLRRTLQRPTELREDAPEFNVEVPVRTANDPETTRRVARRMLRRKRMRLTAPARTALHGFARDPYAVADALWTLGTEGLRREIRLDEVRYGLANLESHRLLREGPRSARKGVASLLAADGPISQAELARRAGISTQSWRNHRETLAAAGLVDEVAGGWRLTLPFRHERGDDVEDVADPWLLDPDTDVLPGSAASRAAPEVLDELAIRLGRYENETLQEALTWPYHEGPPPDVALRAIDAGLLARFVAAHVDVGPPDPPAALVGPDLEQLPLEALQHPQKTPTGG